MAGRKLIPGVLLLLFVTTSLFYGFRPRDTVLGAEPVWSDALDGKADSGAQSFSGPNAPGQPPLKGVSWVNDGIGQAASLGSMDSYIGYPGSRLKPEQGTILFRYKPIADLAGTFATRNALWTDYGQAKPPQEGFLLDTIGWNGAPRGSFALTLNPAAGGNLSFLIWDGSKWHTAAWKTPDGWRWDAGRWYEIGATWGPGGMGIFMDGEMKAKLVDVVSVNNSIPWFLGQAPWSWPYGPHSIMGAYDEVRVYGEQLAPYQPAAPAGAAASQPAASSPPAGSGAPASGAGSSASPAPGSGASPAPATAPTTAPSGGASASSQSVPTARPVAPGSGAGALPAAGGEQKPESQAGATAAAGAGDQSGSVAKPPQSPATAGQATAGSGAPGQAGDGGIAGQVGRLLDITNLLPGGPGGDAARAARQLPGGPAVLWVVPLLVVFMLGIWLGGLGRRRKDQPGNTPIPVAAEASAGARFCDMCGGALQPGAGFCGKCGAEVEQGL